MLQFLVKQYSIKFQFSNIFVSCSIDSTSLRYYLPLLEKPGKYPISHVFHLQKLRIFLLNVPFDVILISHYISTQIPCIPKSPNRASISWATSRIFNLWIDIQCMDKHFKCTFGNFFCNCLRIYVVNLFFLFVSHRRGKGKMFDKSKLISRQSIVMIWKAQRTTVKPVN